jgi:hypothetical protein
MNNEYTVLFIWTVYRYLSIRDSNSGVDPDPEPYGRTQTQHWIVIIYTYFVNWLKYFLYQVPPCKKIK